MKRKRRSDGAAERRRGGRKGAPDRFALYELCAQAPERDARMLRAIHGGTPRVLGEDFAGTAALSRAWVRLGRGARAIAVDHDAEPLERARGARGVRVVCADVLGVGARADVVCALNFSICELHARRGLVRYLRHVRRRLSPGGVFVADLYAGADAFVTGTVKQRVRLERGGAVQYEWEQRHADALTGRVVNAMHFTLRRGGRRVRLEDAFVYDWRLWSVPELRGALEEAGFAASEVYGRFAEAADAEGNLYVSPVRDAQEVGESFSVYVVGRR